MNRSQFYRTGRRLVAEFAGASALGVALGACTLIYIEGEHNSVNDAGGHGGGVVLPDLRPASRQTGPDLLPAGFTVKRVDESVQRSPQVAR